MYTYCNAPGQPSCSLGSQPRPRSLGILVSGASQPAAALYLRTEPPTCFGDDQLSFDGGPGSASQGSRPQMEGGVPAVSLGACFWSKHLGKGEEGAGAARGEGAPQCRPALPRSAPGSGVGVPLRLPPVVPAWPGLHSPEQIDCILFLLYFTSNWKNRGTKQWQAAQYWKR